MTLTFKTFEPGSSLGENRLKLTQDLLDNWIDLFPDEKSALPELPPGMISAITMRAFLEAVIPRPKGNIHGTQEFEVQALPKCGDMLVTKIFCEAKEMRNDNKWVYFETVTQNLAGDLFFKGRMGIIWGA